MKIICVLIVCFHTFCEYFLKIWFKLKFNSNKNSFLSIGSTGCSPVQRREIRDPGCSRDAKRMADICADKLWFVGRKSRKYPENEWELQKHCKQTTNLIKCVKDFTDLCANEGQRQLANVMLFTMRVNDKSYCTKAAKSRELMSLGVCGNQIREQTDKCMDVFLLLLGKSNAYETRFKVPHACWWALTIDFALYWMLQEYFSPALFTIWRLV